MKIKMIQTEEYQIAEGRIAEIAGCLEDTPEEYELVTLQHAVEIWESNVRRQMI